MSQQARVHSIDALQDFRIALTTFSHEGRQALDLVEVEINRVMDWLSHDRLKYWQHEIRKREDAVNEARMELSRCMMAKSGDGDGPACTEQKKAWEKAKVRLKEAEDKLQKVKHWIMAIQQEINEYRGPAQQLVNVLDGSIPSACGLLDRMLITLESYLSMSPSEAASQAVASMAQKGTSTTPAAATEAAPAATDPAKGA